MILHFYRTWHTTPESGGGMCSMPCGLKSDCNKSMQQRTGALWLQPQRLKLSRADVHEADTHHTQHRVGTPPFCYLTGHQILWLMPSPLKSALKRRSCVPPVMLLSSS